MCLLVECPVVEWRGVSGSGVDWCGVSSSGMEVCV